MQDRDLRKSGPKASFSNTPQSHLRGSDFRICAHLRLLLLLLLLFLK